MKIKSKRILLALLPAMLCLLTGCRRESPLGSRFYTEAVGIDVGAAEKTVTMQGYLADQGDAGDRKCMTVTGESITEALAELTGQTGREPYFPHNRALVVSEEAARQGLEPLLLFFTDYTGCRPGVPLFVAEGTAAEVVEALSGEHGTDARLLSELTDPELMAGRTMYTPLYTTMTANGAGDFAAPLVRAEENGLRVTGTAIFRAGVLTGRLTAEETVALHLMRGTLKNTLVRCTLPEGNVTVAVTADEMVCRTVEDGCHLRAVCRGTVFESDFPVSAGGAGPVRSMLETECRVQLTEWVQSAMQKLGEIPAKIEIQIKITSVGDNS
ncbi:MAG: hypothetical protein IJY28_10260 [Clostridia bacterium]|nr:hypothetical protein [Clostridia bacterium]